MRAYWIDTPNAQVVEIDYDDNYSELARKWLKCDLYTCVQVNAHGDMIFVDDEGLINGNPHGWFLLPNRQPLRGYGLVLGTGPAGESIPPYMTLQQAQRIIEFPKEVNEALIDRTITVRSL